MKKKNIKKAYLYIVTIAVLFMGIGYAAVNSVLLELNSVKRFRLTSPSLKYL